MKNRRVLVYVGLIAVLALVVGTFVACSSKGSSDSGSTSQAASSSSAAKGAVALSDSVGSSADMATATIPEGYAPGKGGVAVNTEDIGSIDPRLKNVVDKMVGVLQKTGSKTAAAKPASFKTAGSAPSSAGTLTATGTCTTGNWSLIYDVASTGTETTYTLDATFNNCYNAADNDLLNGTLSAIHTMNSISSNYEYASVVALLTNTTFTVSSEVTGTFVMDGMFTAERRNDHTSGTRTASGMFTWIEPATGGVNQYVFTFGTGTTTPITDTWSKLDNAGDITWTRTGNGAYGLSITTPSSSLALDITLTNMGHKVIAYSLGSLDEWINGSINIKWTPDLSQWGCLSGAYTFTTASGTPIHYPVLWTCPTSGVLKVNNATLEYGKPSGTQVTVTVDGFSEVYPSCGSLGRGLCR